MTAQPESFATANRADLAQRLGVAGLGLLQNGEFSAVPISLTPWVITKAQWKVAFITARALGKLFVNMAQQPQWLSSTISELPETSLANRLRVASNLQERTATLININRHDLMLDSQQNWKLIESNSIAAGMGPFSEALQSLLQEQATHTDAFLPNPATNEQAKAIYEAAVGIRSAKKPRVIFVVEPNEDNVFDQQKLSNALTHLGAKVQFKTLNELRTQTQQYGRDLSLADGSVVDALYWRTGYNLVDYGSDENEIRQNIRFRAELEQMHIALCPTIDHQLTTNKWVQMRLSKLSIDQLMTHFELTTQEAILVTMALHVPQKTPASLSDLKAHLKSKQWIWKQQGEGGGNVFMDGQDLTEDDLDGTVLMKKIEPYPTSRQVLKFSNGNTHTLLNASSELGIFTAGDQQAYGGYLLRTKPQESLETGVHKGHGMIDTILIREEA